MSQINFNGTRHAEQARIQRSDESDRPTRGEQPASNAAVPGTEPDKINVSDRAATVACLVARASELPEIRQERVESLRQLVQSGTYNPPASDIADAILKDEK